MNSLVRPLDGRVVVVTGATSGIGLETARGLAQLGAQVVVGARDPSRGRAVVDELRQGGLGAELLELDLASFASVRAASSRFLAAHQTLDVLVNNAGVVMRRRELSPDGHELTWATNFLGAFLLTHELLPALKRAPKPRVVNVSSDGHRAGTIHWDDVELVHGFRPFRAYAQSKLAQILFTRELARREPGITVTALHPGGIATQIWRVAPRLMQWVLRLVLAPAAEGARPVIFLSADPAAERASGRYFDRFRETTPSPRAMSAADASRLWDLAATATGTS